MKLCHENRINFLKTHKIFSLEKFIFNVRKWNSLELNGRKETHMAYPVGNFLEFILLCNGQATTGCPSLREDNIV